MAFALGFLIRRYWFLIVLLVLGAVLGFFAVKLYFGFTPPTQVGLGIIALGPIIILGFIGGNVLLSLIGGVIGIFAGKRR